MRFTCFLSALAAAAFMGQASAVHMDHHQLAQVDAFDNYQPLELIQLQEDTAPKKEEAKKESATKSDKDGKAVKPAEKSGSGSDSEDEPKKKTPDGIDGAAKKRRHDEMMKKIQASKDKIASEKAKKEKAVAEKKKSDDTKDEKKKEDSGSDSEEEKKEVVKKPAHDMHKTIHNLVHQAVLKVSKPRDALAK